MNNNNPYGLNNPYLMNIPQQQSAVLQTAPPQQMPNQPALNGKIVDSEDVVKATEVPIGGYGIFPRADLSEIYIKSWNNNGTTSVITFKPVVPEPAESAQIGSGDLTNLLLQRIDNIESKLDLFLAPPPRQEQQQPQQTIKKEVTKNGF